MDKIFRLGWKGREEGFFKARIWKEGLLGGRNQKDWEGSQPKFKEIRAQRLNPKGYLKGRP